MSPSPAESYIQLSKQLIIQLEDRFIIGDENLFVFGRKHPKRLLRFEINAY